MWSLDSREWSVFISSCKKDWNIMNPKYAKLTRNLHWGIYILFLRAKWSWRNFWLKLSVSVSKKIFQYHQFDIFLSFDHRLLLIKLSYVIDNKKILDEYDFCTHLFLVINKFWLFKLKIFKYYYSLCILKMEILFGDSWKKIFWYFLNIKTTFSI